MSYNSHTIFAIAVVAALAPYPCLAQTDVVSVGANGFVSDAPLFIAEQKGFFREQKLDVKLVKMTAGGAMTAPLATGQLDVGGGSLSAGLYNSALRGITTKIVADKSRPTSDSSNLQLILRKGLAGRVKTFADLKGLKIGMNGKWGVQASTLNEFLKAGGLKFEDVEIVWHLTNSQQLVALSNGGIDAALNTDTGPAQAFDRGIAVKFGIAASVYPNQQSSVLYYSEKFIKERRAVAVRFMIAYLKGARFFTDGLVNGMLSGPRGREVIDILARDSLVKDKGLLARMSPNGCDPDGQVNIESMNKDIAFFRSHKVVIGDITAESIVDDSFAKQAIAAIGPYKRNQQR